MDRLLFDVLNRIADNLFLIREELAGITFYECDSFCGSCKHWNKRGFEFPCNDCKHVVGRKKADRYAPIGGQHGTDGNG